MEDFSVVKQKNKALPLWTWCEYTSSSFNMEYLAVGKTELLLYFYFLSKKCEKLSKIVLVHKLESFLESICSTFLDFLHDFGV